MQTVKIVSDDGFEKLDIQLPADLAAELFDTALTYQGDKITLLDGETVVKERVHPYQGQHTEGLEVVDFQA